MDSFRNAPLAWKWSGVNHLDTFGRWAFAEFTSVYEIEADFKAKVEKEFARMITQAAKP